MILAPKVTESKMNRMFFSRRENFFTDWDEKNKTDDTKISQILSEVQKTFFFFLFHKM